ncbi:MAG: hypothetical protein EOR91_31965, partial [Mesorhizobium sp.]
MTIHSIGSRAAVRSAETRVAAYDWQALAGEMSGYGCAVMEKLLTPQECREVAGLYPDESHFRSHVHMARHGFGKGEYRYFRYPLPELIGGLRTALYPRLAAVANDWNQRMSIAQRYPDEHAAFLKPSVGFAPACAIPSASSSTTRSEGCVDFLLPSPLVGEGGLARSAKTV